MAVMPRSTSPRPHLVGGSSLVVVHGAHVGDGCSVRREAPDRIPKAPLFGRKLEVHQYDLGRPRARSAMIVIWI